LLGRQQCAEFSERHEIFDLVREEFCGEAAARQILVLSDLAGDARFETALNGIAT
jgi:hypothetical protein